MGWLEKGGGALNGRTATASSIAIDCARFSLYLIATTCQEYFVFHYVAQRWKLLGITRCSTRKAYVVARNLPVTSGIFNR